MKLLSRRYTMRAWFHCCFVQWLRILCFSKCSCGGILFGRFKGTSSSLVYFVSNFKPIVLTSNRLVIYVKLGFTAVLVVILQQCLLTLHREFREIAHSQFFHKLRPIDLLLLTHVIYCIFDYHHKGRNCQQWSYIVYLLRYCLQTYLFQLKVVNNIISDKF